MPCTVFSHTNMSDMFVVPSCLADDSVQMCYYVGSQECQITPPSLTQK